MKPEGKTPRGSDRSAQILATAQQAGVSPLPQPRCFPPGPGLGDSLPLWAGGPKAHSVAMGGGGVVELGWSRDHEGSRKGFRSRHSPCALGSEDGMRWVTPRAPWFTLLFEGLTPCTPLPEVGKARGDFRVSETSRRSPHFSVSHSLLSSPSQLDEEELGQLLTQFLRPPPAFHANVIVSESSSSIRQSSENHIAIKHPLTPI